MDEKKKIELRIEELEERIAPSPAVFRVVKTGSIIPHEFDETTGRGPFNALGKAPEGAGLELA